MLLFRYQLAPMTHSSALLADAVRLAKPLSKATSSPVGLGVGADLELETPVAGADGEAVDPPGGRLRCFLVFDGGVDLRLAEVQVVQLLLELLDPLFVLFDLVRGRTFGAGRVGSEAHEQGQTQEGPRPPACEE